MQTITISGTIGKDAELRNAGSSEVCSFSVAVNQGFGDKKTTNWFRVNLWGKRGSSLHPYLLKGGKVAVSGELDVSEYQGKTQLGIRANEVDLMGGNKDRHEKPQQRDTGFGPGSFGSDELDDDLPF